jgi:hypothetical protein
MMRKILIAAMMAAAVSLAVPALSSAAVGNVKCDGNPGLSGTVTSNVTVQPGAVCVLYGADLQKNIDVYGTLKTFGQIHFEGNVNVHPGGSFAASNWPVTIDKDLSITDPAANSQNGFWGDYQYDSDSGRIFERSDLHLNVVRGSINYTIDANANYPMYQSPLMYFGGGVTAGSFTYLDQGVGFPGHLDTGGLLTATSSITTR